jgi:hypothetical protein
MTYSEIIADNLSKAGWSWGCVSAVDSNGRTIFVADAHCGDRKRFVVHADEKLTAFVELEAAIRPGPAVMKNTLSNNKSRFLSILVVLTAILSPIAVQRPSQLFICFG